ncbi:hypothetical protein CDD80_2450 [Ophiocordyceps camponoti-rufipedis]|uniref:Uncharacterized protein n=1 Tax=Ophiocordyceps camponoti-rufipedis TaxID=2004952 RepID=A0A2C5Z670_9HYPO|nr:hypothetical protein CDD80_2450 [Ophiocordyceps camponoti-rufipedis]
MRQHRISRAVTALLLVPSILAVPLLHDYKDVMRHLSSSPPAPVAPKATAPWTRRSRCASLACVWTNIVHGLSSATLNLSDELDELKDFIVYALDDEPPTTNDDGDYVEWRDGTESTDDIAPCDEGWLRAVTADDYGDDGYLSYPRQPPLLTAIALAALALGLFCLWGIHRNTVRLCLEDKPSPTALSHEEPLTVYAKTRPLEGNHGERQPAGS